MAGRIIDVYNRNLSGIVPALHKILRMTEYQSGRITSFIMAPKQTAKKLKRGFYINVVGTHPHGFKLLARNGIMTQEVGSTCILSY